MSAMKLNEEFEVLFCELDNDFMLNRKLSGERVLIDSNSSSDQLLPCPQPEIYIKYGQRIQ
jgi:hypothetical protein